MKGEAAMSPRRQSRPRGDALGAIARTAALAAAMALGYGPSAAAGEAEADAEKAAICAKAEERYKSLFGKAMADEPVKIIAMYKYTFCPLKLEVKQGETVRFINLDKRTSHSVWFKDAGKPESDRYFGGEGADVVIDLEPGDHTYLCGPHHEREKMIGEVTVLP